MKKGIKTQKTTSQSIRCDFSRVASAYLDKRLGKKDHPERVGIFSAILKVLDDEFRFQGDKLLQVFERVQDDMARVAHLDIDLEAAANLFAWETISNMPLREFQKLANLATEEELVHWRLSYQIGFFPVKVAA